MKVFVASAMPTSYPYKLQKPSTVSNRVRETAETFILDSGIGDDVSNQEVLDLAVKHDAEYVIAKDYLHDIDETIDSTREFMHQYQSHECGAIPMCPLQPDYQDHWFRLPTEIKAWFDHFVLGGMAVDDVSTTDQLTWIEDFNEVAPEVYAHGLGVGGGMEFVEKVAGKGYLDSIDCATPEMAGQFGCVLDERLRQQQVRVMNGEGASKRNIALSEFNSYQIQDVWNREINCRTDLSGYA
jgi:hypothetical protein